MRHAYRFWDPRPVRHVRRGPLSLLLPAAIPALLVAAALTASTATPLDTSSSPADVLISQVYGGGGETGSTWTSDFVELTNRGGDRIDLSGWSVQYAPARGGRWQVTPLAGSIPARGRYLIAGATGSNGTTQLPSPSLTGSLSLGTTSGKIALVRRVAPLRCVVSCTTVEGVRDFVGYGNADDAEGRTAPMLSVTTAALRRDTTASPNAVDSAHASSIEDDPGGPAGVESGSDPADGQRRAVTGSGVDTGDNSADFVAATPAPPGGRGDPAGRVAQIADIQGRSHASPLAGRLVTAVPGVVTAVGRTGFWMQDPTPDDDPATSDGLFVYTGVAPRVQDGEAVRVAGTVAEYRPGGSAGVENLSTTELIRPTVDVVTGAASRPVPVLIGPGGRVPPPQVRTDTPGNVEASRLFTPTVNALDFYESLEGMLVRVTNPVVTGPTSVNGQLPVLPGGAGSPRTARGGLRYAPGDQNTERVLLDDLLAPLPVADVGDRMPGAVDGVIDYAAGDYRIEVLTTPEIVSGRIQPESARPAVPGELSIATLDVGAVNLTGEPAPVRQLAATVVGGLKAPDILAVAEVPDDSGRGNDGTVSAAKGWLALIEAIRAAGGPRYSYRQIDPVDGRDGSAAENRRAGFLYNPARVVFVDRRGTAPLATTGTTAVASVPAASAPPASSVGVRATPADPQQAPVPSLTFSPGRITPDDAAFAAARKSLAGEFRFRGQTVFVVANHFVADNADDPPFGRQQPPRRTSEQQRGHQAAAVRGFVDSLVRADPAANVVVLGELAAAESSPALGILTAGGGLVDLTARLPAADRYSYLDEGNAVLLDHVLVSSGLASSGSAADVVHAQSEFAARWSDSDPVVGYLRMPVVSSATASPAPVPAKTP